MKVSLRSLLIAVAVVSNAAYGQASGYHVVKSYRIQSAGRWDYLAVSPVNDNLYVSHMTQVNILNKNTGDSVGVIPNTDGVHGIAFAEDYKEGFISNGGANTITVFNIGNDSVLAQIKGGSNPDGIMYDLFSKKVFVCNGKSKDLTIIDPATNAVVKTVSLGGKPETAVTDEAGRIYINIEDKNEIVVVNATSYALEKHWKLGRGKSPTGLAIDTKTRRLFAGCGNKLLEVMNADNGKIVRELPIGDGCDGVAFSSALNFIFSANGEGTMTVVQENSADDFAVIDNVPTKKGARTIALDPRTNLLFLPTADFDEPAPGESRPQMIPGTFQVLVMRKRTY